MSTFCQNILLLEIFAGVRISSILNRMNNPRRPRHGNQLEHSNQSGESTARDLHSPTALEEKKKGILKDYADYINPSRARVLKSAGLDLVEAKREGPFVWDITGKRFVDCMTGAGSFNVGRRNPKVIAALKNALDTYDIGGFLFFSEPKVELAKKLASISPEKALKCTTFGCGGGEVVDFSIKLARGFTGRSEIISTEKSYHGHTGFALSAIGRDVYQKPFQPLMPNFSRVPYGDLDAMKNAITERTAAVLLEPIQGEGGIHVPPLGYLRQVKRLCEEKGALLIIDEIQTGFGRTGRMFASEHDALVPDIMTVGKSLGGSLYPIAAAMYREELQDFLFANPFIHFSTFGGADLGCVVGLETIKYIEENRLWEHAEKMGRVFQQGYDRLLQKYPAILKEVRRKGLMMGLQYTEDHLGPRMSFELAKNGVIAVFSGNDPKVMRIMPSLVIQDAEVQFVIEALDKSMNTILEGGIKHG